MKRPILIVDDDAGVRVVLTALLEAAGFEVVEATDGVEGVERFRAHAPSLALVDVSMPRQDGLETIRQVRSVWPNAKLVAMSGAGSVAGRSPARAAREAGAQAFLAKPIGWRDLVATIDRVLHEGSVERR